MHTTSTCSFLLTVVLAAFALMPTEGQTQSLAASVPRFVHDAEGLYEGTLGASKVVLYVDATMGASMPFRQDRSDGYVLGGRYFCVGDGGDTQLQGWSFPPDVKLIDSPTRVPVGTWTLVSGAQLIGTWEFFAHRADDIPLPVFLHRVEGGTRNDYEERRSRQTQGPYTGCGRILPEYRVVPGTSVGRARLGMTRAEMRTLLGAPGRATKDANLYIGGGKRGHYLLVVFGQDSRASRIEFTSPRFRTDSGIGVGDTIPVPETFGLAWLYPQLLAKSGLAFLGAAGIVFQGPAPVEAQLDGLLKEPAGKALDWRNAQSLSIAGNQYTIVARLENTLLSATSDDNQGKLIGYAVFRGSDRDRPILTVDDDELDEDGLEIADYNGDGFPDLVFTSGQTRCGVHHDSTVYVFDPAKHTFVEALSGRAMTLAPDKSSVETTECSGCDCSHYTTHVYKWIGGQFVVTESSEGSRE
jgi:hypothetical protein